MIKDQDIIIIDGIRRVEDIVALEPSPMFTLLAIDVPAPLRYERIKGRGEKIGEQNTTWEQFLNDENAPTEITIPEVMARASKTISNTGSREEFEKSIRSLMQELGFKPTQQK